MSKILLIEDEFLISDSVLAILERENYTVVLAEDGKQGLSMISEHHPDLVLCDIEMPEITGHQVLASVRQNPQTATLPFVFLTGNAERHQMRYGMQLGADDYLTKPFTADELCATVVTQLQKQQVHQQLTQIHWNDFRQSLASSLPEALVQPLTQVVEISNLLCTEGAELINSPEGGSILAHLQYSSQRIKRLTENFILYLQIELMLSDPEGMQLFKQSQQGCQAQAILPVVAQKKAEEYQRASDLFLQIESAHLSIADDDLRKIVDEILDNAFRFSTPGTPVQVNGSVTAEGFHVSISDQGQGLTPEQLTTLTTRSRSPMHLQQNLNHGLGLAITRRMLALYEGKFHLESIPHLATVVRLEFPIA